MRKTIACIILITCTLFCNAQIRVACIGNSITAGFGLQQPEKEAWPAVLSDMLTKAYGENTYEVKNFGISARTLLMKGDMPWMKEPFFKDVLNYNPQIVFIKLGTNDTKSHNWKYGDEFQKDLETLIIILQSQPAKPKIILCNPITIYENNWDIRDEILTDSIIPIIKSISETYHLQLIDLHTNMAKNLYLPDGVHPNKDGSKIIAETIFKEAFSSSDKK